MIIDVDLVERLRSMTHESDGIHGIFEVRRNPDGPAAAAAIESLQSQLAERDAMLADPAMVHLNTLRGGIARMTLPQIFHIYGEEAIRAFLERTD